MLSYHRFKSCIQIIVLSRQQLLGAVQCLLVCFLVCIQLLDVLQKFGESVLLKTSPRLAKKFLPVHTTTRRPDRVRRPGGRRRGGGGVGARGPLHAGGHGGSGVGRCGGGAGREARGGGRVEQAVRRRVRVERRGRRGVGEGGLVHAPDAQGRHLRTGPRGGVHELAEVFGVHVHARLLLQRLDEAELQGFGLGDVPVEPLHGADERVLLARQAVALLHRGPQLGLGLYQLRLKPHAPLLQRLDLRL
mmetsp:Transcript_5492/g.10356  ORF Transcript_5492/g.10356 Transcript_5492/m.10356 type:complete len:247 (+) Transcript_5492:325-1065(+)